MKIATIVIFTIMALVFAFYIYSTIQVHRNCNGHVVKNQFDWPVCVH